MSSEPASPEKERLEWRRAADEAALTYEAWQHASLGRREEARVVYLAAADRERAASDAYEKAVQAAAPVGSLAWLRRA